MNHHPDRKSLERFLVDDLPPIPAKAVEQHLVDCVACRDYLAALRRDRADRLTAVSPDSFMATLSTKRQAALRAQRVRWAVIGSLGLSSAAMAVAVMTVLGGHPTSTTASQFKGGGAPGVMVHRKRGDEVRIMGDTDRIRAGDLLRVEVAMARSDRVSAWLEAGSGRLDLAAGDGGLVLQSGTWPFPGSAVVEAPCVSLTLVVHSGGGTVRRELACE